MRPIFRTIVITLVAASLMACTATDTRKTLGEGIDDSVLVTKVKTALLADQITDGLDIDVEAFRGRIQLNGFVDDAEEIDAATRVVRNIEGVESFSNNLELVSDDRRTGRYIDDQLLTGRISAAFASSDEVSALDIEIQVNRGLVQLGGFVDERDDIRRAEEIAKNVAGVERVINRLEVKRL